MLARSVWGMNEQAIASKGVAALPCRFARLVLSPRRARWQTLPRFRFFPVAAAPTFRVACVFVFGACLQSAEAIRRAALRGKDRRNRRNAWRLSWCPGRVAARFDLGQSADATIVQHTHNAEHACRPHLSYVMLVPIVRRTMIVRYPTGEFTGAAYRFNKTRGRRQIEDARHSIGP